MKTTLADRIAVATTLAAVLLTAGIWGSAVVLEQRYEQLRRTVFAVPTCTLDNAMPFPDAFEAFAAFGE